MRSRTSRSYRALGGVPARTHTHAGNFFGPLVSETFLDRLFNEREEGEEQKKKEPLLGHGEMDEMDTSLVFVSDESALSTSEVSTKSEAAPFGHDYRYEGRTTGTIVLRHYRAGDQQAEGDEVPLASEPVSVLAETKFHVWDGVAIANKTASGQLLGVRRNSYHFWEETASDVCFCASDGEGSTVGTGKATGGDVRDDGILITAGFKAGRERQERDDTTKY